VAEKFDVVIVGGGIFGCSVAYQICRMSNLNVALVERGAIATQTTALAASVVTRGRSALPQIELVLETFAAIGDLESRLGESLNFNAVGSLHVARSKQSAETFAAQAELLKQTGDAPCELTIAQARKLTPWLELDQAECIFHNPADGFVDPYRLASAYLQGARAHGGLSIFQETSVSQLETNNRNVTGVMTDKGFLAADQVVVTAGPWANLLLRPLGSASAMTPVRSHYWITEPNQIYPAHSPVMILPEANAYTRPENGSLLFGLRDQTGKWAHPSELPVDLQGFSFDEDYEGWEALQQSVEPFMEVCPSLADVNIRHYISGPSCYTPDGNYVIGAAPGLYNVYLASGCCGSGISTSGGVGKSIAELVFGRSTSIDISAFSPDRFTDFDPFDPAFQEKCASSRFQKKAG